MHTFSRLLSWTTVLCIQFEPQVRIISLRSCDFEGFGLSSVFFAFPVAPQRLLVLLELEATHMTHASCSIYTLSFVQIRELKLFLLFLL